MTETQHIAVVLFATAAATGVVVAFIAFHEARYSTFLVRVLRSLKAYFLTLAIIGLGGVLAVASIYLAIYTVKALA